MSGFKIDDTVRVVAHPLPERVGMTGLVVFAGPSDSTYRYEVVLDGHTTYTLYGDSELVLA